VQEEYIDIKQLAAWLCIKPATGYKLAENGTIPSYKLGKLRRFKTSEIIDYLEKSCKQK
jgi:excisionase family DNA binding protein